MQNLASSLFSSPHFGQVLNRLTSIFRAFPISQTNKPGFPSHSKRVYIPSRITPNKFFSILVYSLAGSIFLPYPHCLWISQFIKLRGIHLANDAFFFCCVGKRKWVVVASLMPGGKECPSQRHGERERSALFERGVLFLLRGKEEMGGSCFSHARW